MSMHDAAVINTSPKRRLAGATLGFFVGFAAVALLGPITHRLQFEIGLSPIQLGLALAAPMLSGSLLRIPFSISVDIGGGRRPRSCCSCFRWWAWAGCSSCSSARLTST